MARKFEWVEVYCDVSDLIIDHPDVSLESVERGLPNEGVSRTWSHRTVGVVLRETTYPHYSDHHCVHEVPGPTIGPIIETQS